MYAIAWGKTSGIREASIEVKIGIDSGTLYGGIVASEKLTYDYWGKCIH